MTLKYHGIFPGINRSHPCSSGLLVACPINVPNGDRILSAVDPAFYATLVSPVNASWKMGIDGIGFQSSVGTDYAHFGAVTAYSPFPAPFTAAVRCVMTPQSSGSNYNKVWGAWYSTSPFQNWGIFSHGGVVGVSMGNTNGPIDLFLDSVPVGTTHTFVESWDGSNMHGYIDGVHLNKIAISPTTGAVTGDLAIGANPNLSTEYWSAPIFTVALWNWCLPSGAVAEYCKDPYALFDWGDLEVSQVVGAVPPPPIPPLILGKHLSQTDTPLDYTILQRL